MKTNKGFTLIELVVVIVILGILAVTAVPRFINLSDQANQAAVEGVAGAIASGMAVNYAGCAANDFTAGANCVAVTNACDAAEAGSVLTDAAPLADYTISVNTAAAGTGTGETAVCDIELTADATITTTFTSIDTTP